MRKRETILVDDIDGSTDDVKTISFSYGAKKYQIDLNPAHRRQLEKALRPFTSAGRTTNRKRRKPAVTQ